MKVGSRFTMGLLVVGLGCLIGIVSILSAAPEFWKDLANSPDEIDFVGFMVDSRKAYKARKNRRISVDRFVNLASQPDTIILDTRSKAAFDRKHIKGATHLNFSDITKSSLERVVPSPNSRILIYCNNNFSNNSPAFPSKMGRAALNIPTYVSLYTYGYENVYELGTIENELDTLLEFEGTLVR